MGKIISTHKITAVIPCLNEENYISDIVSKANNHVDSVVVIDDGSTDSTAEKAVAAGASVISHVHRMGAGAATRSGFEYARSNDTDILITLDGDAQHDPDEIPEIFKPILNDRADIVIGSRFIKGIQIRRYRKFGINVITWLYNFGHIEKITDSQCCFRAYSKKAIDVLDITDNKFGFSIQLLVQARKKGLKIVEVPASCKYHAESSTENPVTHGLSVAWSVIKHRLKEMN